MERGGYRAVVGLGGRPNGGALAAFPAREASPRSNTPKLDAKF